MFVSGWTPLHEACNHGHQEITRYLLQNGANVNSKGLEDDTPLHDAVTNSHSDLVELLLQYGANPLLKNKRGERPLDIAEDQAIKDMMLTVIKRRKNSDPEPEWSSPSQSDTSDILLNKNLRKIQTTTSPHSIRYYDSNSSRKLTAFPCDSSGEGSCEEGILNGGQSSVENELIVNGYRAGALTNSTPKRKYKKPKDHLNSRASSTIKSTPSGRKHSVSSSADSSLSSSSDSSSDSEDTDETALHKNGVQLSKMEKHGKRKTASNDHIKRKSLFHNQKSLTMAKNSSTQKLSYTSWRKKPSQNPDQRTRSCSYEESKLTSKPNDINVVPQNNIQKQNGTDPSSFNGFANISRNNGGQSVDDSIYDFSPSIEDNMIATSGISLKREYKDKSSELFDMVCLGKPKEAVDIDDDISRFKCGVETVSHTTSTPPIKDKLTQPKPELNGTSVEKLTEAKKPAKTLRPFDTSVPISKSNGVGNEGSHIESSSFDNTSIDVKKNISVTKVPVANIALDLSRNVVKPEKKSKKQHISMLSPKKMQEPIVSPFQGITPVSKKESKTDVNADSKSEKKKKAPLPGEIKTSNDKHPTSGSHSHKKKKKRNRKHSQEVSSGEHKQRNNSIAVDEPSSDKTNVPESIVSTHTLKPLLKRTDSTKSLQRKLSLDVKTDQMMGTAKKKMRSSDSACSEPGLKNSKQTMAGNKSLKHSSSSHSLDKSGSNQGKRDKTEARKCFLVSDENCSFLSELEKSSRQRLEQEQKLKIQRKKKLQQLKAEAALKKQNALLSKKTSNEKFSHPSSDISDSTADKNANQTRVPDSLFHPDNNNMGSPLHEQSNSMSSIDSQGIPQRLPPSRSMSQLDLRGVASVGLSGCWSQSPNKSSFVELQDPKTLPVNRSLSFSGQPDGTVNLPLHIEYDGVNNTGVKPEPTLLRPGLAPTASHSSPHYSSQQHVRTALPVDGTLLSPAVQPVHEQSQVTTVTLPSASSESFPSNVPISSPMVATRVPDQCLIATQPTGSMSQVTTAASSPDQSKAESPVKVQSDEICAEKCEDLDVSNGVSQTSDNQQNSKAIEAKRRAEEESENLRILAEKQELEKKQALQIYINDRLSELGNVIDEKVPKQLPVFIPMENLEAAGNKNPLHDRMNIYEEWMIIQKQISERRKKYYAAVLIPQAPNCYLEYMTYRGTYLLGGRKESWLSVPLLAPPPSLGEDMRALFGEHERERVKLRLQHATQREKLIVACEQEIMRVHSRAARMLQNQQVPLSACSVFLDREVYHLERQAKRAGDENTNRVSIRDRFNGRMMLSWLQDVDDKYVKIKKVLLDRQRHESHALHAVQRTEWFLKVQEIENHGQQKKFSDSKPEDVSELYVPLVNISDDFPLLPG